MSEVESTLSDDIVEAPRALLNRWRSIADSTGARRTAPGRNTRNGRLRKSSRGNASRPSSGEDSPGDPKLLGGIFDQLTKNHAWESGLAVGRVLACWREIVPASIAERCSAEGMEGTVLLVQCDSPAWVAQMKLHSTQIVELIASRLGSEVVTEIRATSVLASKKRRN
ncbi:DUF721 domain-containing protein [Glutamicibacter sp. AOP38-B1-38]|uniref:DUF721 domain-containing protein n=1 Tax=Glutamicibacter sp. AOP38-B1-38 TaxID=3457680 RepID=UPI004034E93A